MKAALFYFAGFLGFWLCIWKITSYLPWRPLRWWITWIYFCVVLTPWQGTEPEVYYAPAIIVAAFDFLDLGMADALEILRPMFAAMIAGSVVIVFLAIVLKIRQLKRNDQPEPDQDPDTTGA